MFFMDGIRQLKNQRAKTIAIVIGITFGVAMMFLGGILSDTTQYGSEKRFQMIYGDMDYTVYRTDGMFSDNDSLTVPDSYLGAIKSYPGVDHAASRIVRGNGFFLSDDESDIHYDYVAGINQSNPDERYLGISLVVDCLPQFGDPNVIKIEDLLDTSIVTNPIVISKKISENYGWNTGDVIKIVPINATKAYATPAEIANVTAGNMTAAQLEAALRLNTSRWIDFTVTGVVIDASEVLEKPIPHKRNSLNTISAKDNSVYIPMSHSLRYVFNNRTTDGIFYFVISTGEGFNPNGLAVSLSSINVALPIDVFDLYEHIQEYADYFMMIIRILFILIGSLTLLVSCSFIKNMMEVNVKDQIRVVGILKVQGFKDTSISQMFLSQILLLSAIGTGLGYVLGYFLSGFIDLSFVYIFLSYNYQYTLPVEISNVITITSIVVSGAMGIGFSTIYGMYPVGLIKRWRILELLNPTFKELEEYGTMDTTKGRGIKRTFNRRKNLLLNLLNEKMMDIERKSHPGKKVRRASMKNPVRKEVSDVKRQNPRRKKDVVLKISDFGNRIDALMADGYTGSVKFKMFSAKKTMLYVSIALLCVFIMPLSARNLFPDAYIHITAGDQYYWIAGLFASIIFFMISLWMVFGDFIGYIGSSFAALSGKFLRGLKRFTGQSIRANLKKNKNMVGFMTMGIALLVILSCVFQSVVVGTVKNDRTSLGGDITVFQPIISRNDLAAINQIDGVRSATSYMFLTMEDWSFNRAETTPYIVNSVNGWGGKHDSVNQLLNVVILGNVEEYLNVNLGKAYIVTEEQFVDEATFVRRLNEPKSAIIDKRLATDLNIGIGSQVAVNINGFESNLKVVGVARNMPAAPYMSILDWEAGDFNDATKHRTLITTRETLSIILDDFVSNVDIIVKNKTMDSITTNRTISEDIKGYLSGRMNRTIIDSVLDSVDGIDKYSHRFSTFAPTAPTLLARNITDSRVVYKRNETFPIGDNMNITSRFYAFDPSEENGIVSESRVIDAIPQLSILSLPDIDGDTLHTDSITDISYTLDHVIGNTLANTYRNIWLKNNSYCIVNKYTAVYVEDTSTIEYVYENRIGDLFNLTMKDGEDEYSMQFEVVATIDNHISYYHDNLTEKEGFVFSPRTFNYNCHLNQTEIDNADFYDIFDIDANVFLTSYNELSYMQHVITGLPFGFQSESLMNHIYVKVEDGYNIDNVIEQINSALAASSYGPIVNVSVFNFKETLIDKLTNYGCLAVLKEDGYDDNTVAINLRNWYVANGYEWKESSVGMHSRFNSESQLAEPLFEAFTMNFSITIVMNAMALAVGVYINMRSRYKEFGILKSQSFDNQTIRRFTFIESLTISFIGALIGLGAGLSIVSIIFNEINAVILRPLVLEIPWLAVTMIIGVIFLIQVLTSQVQSRYMDRLTAAESMRFE